MIIDQQKVGFIRIFAAEIKKNAKYAHTFLVFRYNIARKRRQSHSQKPTKSFTDYLEIHFFLYNYRVGLNIFRFFGIIGVRELAIYKTKFYTQLPQVLHQGVQNSLFLV